MTPLAMTVSEILTDIQARNPGMITAGQLESLKSDMRSANFKASSTGDLQPMYEVLDRISAGATESGLDGTALTTGVQLIHDLISGNKPPMNPEVVRRPQQQQPKSVQPKAGIKPWVSPRAQREASRLPRRPMSDQELYRLRDEARARRASRGRRMLSPSKLGGNYGVRLNYNEDDEQ